LKLAGAICGVVGEGDFSEPTEPAARGIALDRLIEPGGVERLELGAKGREVLRRELRDGVRDVLNGGHALKVARCRSNRAATKQGGAC
jgi:hypothetical protein